VFRVDGAQQRQELRAAGRFGNEIVPHPPSAQERLLDQAVGALRVVGQNARISAQPG
jgi:hypothetical protein